MIRGVYLFDRTGTTWVQQPTSKASNLDAFDWFGITLALDGDGLAIGAQDERSNATGIDGDEINNDQPNALLFIYSLGQMAARQRHIM